MVKSNKCGSGAKERKTLKREEAYAARSNAASSSQSASVDSKIRVLSHDSSSDCAFAVQFATGVQQEVDQIKKDRIRFNARDVEQSGLTIDRHQHRSVYGFFGKSSLLKESIAPSSQGARHLITRMGVACLLYTSDAADE